MQIFSDFCGIQFVFQKAARVHTLRYQRFAVDYYSFAFDASIISSAVT